MGAWQPVSNGIDHREALDKALKGKRLALITGPTGVDRELRSTASILSEKYVLKRLFAPEHGLRGEAQAGDVVEGGTDPETGLPVYSLYKGHSGRSITAEQLEGIDTVVFDMQDVGARFYTFLYTLTEAMQSCAAAGVEMTVLDRVNPVGLSAVEGAMLDEHFSSFVGRYAVPTRYALTIGEFARYINHAYHLGCTLHVVPCVGYSRDCTFMDTGLCWVMPSPNMPSPVTALAYIGTCLFEGTNLSEGRGTAKPFEMIGAPWLKVKPVMEYMQKWAPEGVKFGTVYFKPTFSKYQGEICEGLQLHIVETNVFKPFAVGLHLLQAIRETHDAFCFLPPTQAGGYPFITHLLGTDAILQGDFDADAFINAQTEALATFRQKSEAWYLYG